ncbi:hypothetical protein WOSG25_110260 [Weissella oryzae SG25]|uniref:Uncharacterized protein n=1 Tax=Weissella oryzae (strain DSM 25784 / JCM 18191 / LMG 30913 / SG25) TaxID=1329250 RepID=A0A069CWE1_WEIOS|nr:hypothetical protein [Weissella oryzae]GAK31548.1 hypothetical protein WOSG25_110260 [Weissella oryzae SG25]
MAFRTKDSKKKAKVTSELFNQIKLAVNTREKFELTQFIAYKKIYRDRENVVELNNDLGFITFLNIPGRDLDFINSEGTEGAAEVIAQYHRFLNVYLDDWDVIISQLPADTTEQKLAWLDLQNRIDQELAQIQDQRLYDQALARRQFATEQIQIAINVGEQITHQDYTAVVHGNSISSVLEKRERFMQEAANSLSPTPMKYERIMMLLRQLNNPTENIEAGGVDE